jgi:hypothetical protein
MPRGGRKRARTGLAYEALEPCSAGLSTTQIIMVTS